MTDNKVEYFVGIDVSKTILDVAIWESEVYWQFGNEAEGWQELIKRLKILSPKLVVIEASGGLEQPVVAELYADGLPWQWSTLHECATLLAQPAS
jgi:transposase